MHVHIRETERTLPLFIANGVTGVRNIGGKLDDLLRWREKVASGTLRGRDEARGCRVYDWNGCYSPVRLSRFQPAC